MEEISKKLIEVLNSKITPIDIQNSSSLQNIIDRIGDASIVLMGEATHGTQEFYQTRMELSKILIEEKGFQAISIEGDWTSAFAINQYIQNFDGYKTPEAALHDFTRFPKWMWRNALMPDFLQWLRNYNDNLKDASQKIGFYGLDLYCLNDSIKAVIDYLQIHDPEAAKRASKRYACFDHANVDAQTYGYLVDARIKRACIREASEQLIEMQHKAFPILEKSISSENEKLFYTTQNARLIKNAEHYYRAMFESREETWNIRDSHMGETLQNLISHLESKFKKPAKIIIWAHNSHIGDARATEMSERKEINIGQIVREHFSNQSFHLGFSTYTGMVTAADDWDGPAKTKNINPGLPGSYEDLFHQLQAKDFCLYLHDEELNHYLNIPRLQRAIGVIYRPDAERFSHYFFTHLPYQFDAVIHLDKTTALTPLDRK